MSQIKPELFNVGDRVRDGESGEAIGFIEEFFVNGTDDNRRWASCRWTTYLQSVRVDDLVHAPLTTKSDLDQVESLAMKMQEFALIWNGFTNPDAFRASAYQMAGEWLTQFHKKVSK